MNIINGTEIITNETDAKEAALIRFYNAFNLRDAALMKSSWLHSNESSMNNPVGGIKRGWDEIASVYNKIFTGEAKVFVEFYDFTFYSTGVMFFVNGRERGFFEIGNKKIDLHIRTSRVFLLTPEGWKQILHHGSIDDPELLAAYQLAVSSQV